MQLYQNIFQITPSYLFILYSNRTNETILWIIKPPNKCKGTGIKVVSNSVQDIPNYPTCVQKYVKNPLLIDGYKVRKEIKSIQMQLQLYFDEFM